MGNKLRPRTVPTFFSALGGISLFGSAGLILAPIALAITIALIDVWWNRTEQCHAAEEALAEQPDDGRRLGAVLQERGS